MRYILLFWALPMGIFWGWFGLSYHDLSFGMPFLTRDVHEFAFTFYGNLLNINPDTIPPLVARACVVDTVFIFAIYGFRKRRELAGWWSEQMRGGSSVVTPAVSEAGRVPPAE